MENFIEYIGTSADVENFMYGYNSLGYAKDEDNFEEINLDDILYRDTDLIEGIDY